jgi:hypothetical protein
LVFLEFLDGLDQDLLVHVVANFVDEAALFAAKHVACAADVEVAQGDVETASRGR